MPNLPLELSVNRYELRESGACLEAGAKTFMKDFLDDCTEKTKSLTEFFT
mgnify:CR=1 FL=1